MSIIRAKGIKLIEAAENLLKVSAWDKHPKMAVVQQINTSIAEMKSAILLHQVLERNNNEVLEEAALAIEAMRGKLIEMPEREDRYAAQDATGEKFEWSETGRPKRLATVDDYANLVRSFKTSPDRPSGDPIKQVDWNETTEKALNVLKDHLPLGSKSEASYITIDSITEQP